VAGLYIATLFVIWQIINFIVFGRCQICPFRWEAL